MQLLDISAETERVFFSCLHLKRPEDPLANAHRRRWYQQYKEVRYKAQVLMLEDGCIVGKCHTIPVEHSPFVGEDLLAILCIYVQCMNTT
jgi:hypothetical protein